MSMPTFDDRHLSIVYSQAPRFIKLGFLNIQSQHIPKLFALSCLIISNFQTLSLLLTNSLLFLHKNDNPVHPVIHSFIQIFAFSDWFSYENSVPVMIWTVAISIFLLHFLVIFTYLNFKITRKTIIPDWIQKYWSLMSYIHPLICFYPIHTFNIKAIQNSNEGNFIDPVWTPIKMLFYLNLIINFWLAIIPTSFFYVLIKTKDILSSKNNINRTKDILSKIIIPILWILADKTDFAPFFILALTVLDSISRDIAFFYYLPYYHIQTLQVSAFFQGIITSLALLTLITKALSYSSLHIEQLFLHVVWIIIASLSAKVYHSYLWRIFRRILAEEDGEMNMYYAMHKKILLRYLMKRRTTPNSDTRIYNWEYFIFQGKVSQISSEEIIKNYTKEACQKNPKSHLAKITLAHYYVKTENSYLLANNLIEEVQRDSPSFPERISLSLIRFELQKRLYQQYSYKENDGTGLNLLQYIQTNNLNDQLKQKIKGQVRQQLEFWNNFLSDQPNMGTLTELALKVGNEKNNVQKIWKELSKARPSAFYSPPLMYGMYISLVNNDTAQGEKFIEQYHTDIIRTSKLLEVDELNNDTMMAEDVVQISMSGSRKKIGYILDCSANINEVYGWKKEFIVKQPIIAIMSPYYQQKHDKFLMHHFNTGTTKLLNNTSLLPVLSSDGYLQPSRVHIKMHPFVEQGISYISVLRVLREPRRMLLIRKDGTIDGMSKNFSVDMNLYSKDNQLKNLTIFHLCPEFRQINSAFNTKALQIILKNSQELPPTQVSFIKGSAFNNSHLSDHALLHEDHPSNLNLKLDQTPHEGSSFSTEIDLRAQLLYDTYSVGAKLAFYPLKTSGPSKIKLLTNRSHGGQQQPVIYHVQITTRIHDKDFIKVVFLDRITEQNDGDLTPLASEKDNIKAHHEESGRVTSSRPLISPSAPVIIKGKSHDLTPDRYIEEEVNMSKTISIPEELMSHEILDSNLTRRSPKKIVEIIKENKEQLLNQRDLSSNNNHDHQEDQIRRTSFEKTRFGKLVGHVLTILNNNNGNRNIALQKKPQKSEYYLSESRRKDESKRPKFGHHHEDLHLERNEGSVASSYFSRGVKVRHLVAQALNTIIYKKHAIIFGISFFIFISLVLGLQILQSFNVIGAIDDIKASTTLIENGALKLNSFISLAMYSRLMAQVLKGNYTIYGLWTNDTRAMSIMCSIYTRDAYEYNNNVWRQVGQIHEDHQEIFYQENIRIYEVANEEETLIGTYKNFDASALILGHSTRFLNQKIPTSYQPGINMDDLQFILYNFYNDFLKSIENTSLVLIDDLQTTLENTNQYILKTNILIIVSAVLFLGVVLWYIIVMRGTSRKFMNILFRLNVREARETKFLLEHFISSFDTNWQDFDQNNNTVLATENFSPRNNKKNTNNTKKIYRTASMGKLYKTQIFTFLKLFPLYVILLGLALGYYFITDNILGEIKQHQTQIQSSLWAFYYQNLLITEFIEMIGSNSTTRVRDDPMEEEILEGLVEIKDIGSFVNEFRNSDGNFTEAQYQVLFDFSCDDFRKHSFGEFESFLIIQCHALSQGTGRTNFPALTSHLYQTIIFWMNEFLISERTKEDLEKIFQVVSIQLQPMALVNPALCTILYRATLEKFEQQALMAQESSWIFSGLILFAILVGATGIWFFVIMRIFRLEGNDKDLLKLVPIHMILGNQYLKQYLLNNSNSQLNNIKNLL